MYDISSRNSFDNIKNWYDEACTYGSNQMYFVLLGNKCEMANNREVPTEEAKLFAQQKKMSFFETSGKDNINVQNSFQFIIEKIVNDIKTGHIDPYNESLGIKVGVNSL